MLSYRHAFHAGGAADVLKHATFTFVVDYLLRKPTPVYVLDTHAGAGAYDLASPEAALTGEHADGVGRLTAVLSGREEAPPLLRRWVELVRAENASAEASGALLRYPGSPALAAALLRPQDRLELAELHPADHAALASQFERRPRVRIARTDGLTLMVQRLPPPERRAVVLVDPSYEVKRDYAEVVRTIGRACRRFPTGVVLLWYPVIERPRTEAFLAGIADLDLRSVLRLELCRQPDAPGQGMTGSGVIVINPPWTLPETAGAGLAWLKERLDARGPVSAGWLVAPQA